MEEGAIAHTHLIKVGHLGSLFKLPTPTFLLGVLDLVRIGTTPVSYMETPYCTGIIQTCQP